jgi:hypothetical protein
MTTLISQARNLRVPKFAEEAVERARLAVVPRQRRAAAPRVPFAILVGLVLLGGVAGLLLFNTHMQKSSFVATALQARADALHAKEQGLRLELDRLRDPQTLAVNAKHFGMRPPDSPIFLDLRSGQVIGQAKPPTGVDDFPVNPPQAAKPSSLRPDPVVLRRKVITVPAKTSKNGVPSPGSTPGAGKNKNPRH